MMCKRLYLLPLLFVIAGCSDPKPVPSTAKEETRAEKKAFDNRQFSETVLWVNDRIQKESPAFRAKNDLAIADALKSIREDFQKAVGTSVKWDLVVESVSRDYITFTNWKLDPLWNARTSKELPVILTVTALTGPGITDSLSRSYEGSEFGRVRIAGPFTVEIAKGLKANDLLRIQGKITRFQLDGHAEKMFCNIIISDAEPVTGK